MKRSELKAFAVGGIALAVVIGLCLWLSGCVNHTLYPEDTEALVAARVLQERAYNETDAGKERAYNKVASCDVRSVFVRRGMTAEADAGSIRCE